jgi:ATP-dependent DNA helicase UvrD/PcrA
MCDAPAPSPAQQASERALSELRQSIEGGQSFKLEAGAGAGKTYSLIEALKYLIQQQGKAIRRRNQRIACITFTNVAKDEIETRTDRNPIIHCDTIHGFCWSIIARYQAQLRDHLVELENWATGQWAERLEEVGGVGDRAISYTLGHRGISDREVSVHHDDVLKLAIVLFGYEKFRNILASQYPIILIDEYQDTDADWIGGIKAAYLDRVGGPLFGFFGDHWQKIYGNGCGELAHGAIRNIGKEANFRSVPAIVECLNRMRPDLPQSVVEPEATGYVRVFHTNGWQGARLSGQHYGGDLPDSAAREALAAVKDRLAADGWNFAAENTKILMLTHRALGKQQGYASLPGVFRYNESFTKKEQPHIAFFADQLEPACRAFAENRYGLMFDALGADKAPVLQADDKRRWSAAMQGLISLRENGTVGDVVSYLREHRLPRLPDSIERLETQLAEFDLDGDEELPRSLREVRDLHAISYKEIISVAQYLSGHSPFETKHGVKGAQFENVLIILGRGWNRYNFSRMLENVERQDQLSERERKAFQDNRNLFYVACSRPQKRLALLFTQELSSAALETLNRWFTEDAVEAFHW